MSFLQLQRLVWAGRLVKSPKAQGFFPIGFDELEQTI